MTQQNNKAADTHISLPQTLPLRISLKKMSELFCEENHSQARERERERFLSRLNLKLGGKHDKNV